MAHAGEGEPQAQAVTLTDDAADAYAVLSLLDDLTFWTRRQLFTADDVVKGLPGLGASPSRVSALLELLQRAGYLQAAPGQPGLVVSPLGRTTLRTVRSSHRAVLPLPVG